MIKVNICCALIIWFVGLISPAFASAGSKIALVSLQRALNEVEEGKKAKADLKQYYDSKKKQLDALKQELETTGAKMEKERLVLSEEAFEKKREDLQQKILDWQGKVQEYDREFKTKEAESAQRILLALRKLVQEQSQKEGYELVIENSAETILFAPEAVEITDQIIALYNKRR